MLQKLIYKIYFNRKKSLCSIDEYKKFKQKKIEIIYKYGKLN